MSDSLFINVFVGSHNGTGCPGIVIMTEHDPLWRSCGPASVHNITTTSRLLLRNSLLDLVL